MHATGWIQVNPRLALGWDPRYKLSPEVQFRDSSYLRWSLIARSYSCLCSHPPVSQSSKFLQKHYLQNISFFLAVIKRTFWLILRKRSWVSCQQLKEFRFLWLQLLDLISSSISLHISLKYANSRYSVSFPAEQHIRFSLSLTNSARVKTPAGETLPSFIHFRWRQGDRSYS